MTLFLMFQVLSGDAFVRCKQASPSPQEALLTARLHKTESSEGGTDSQKDLVFDWYYFWTLLKPQLHYFLGAIGVSFFFQI